MNPSGSTTSISWPGLARSERARWCASSPSITTRSPTRRPKNAGKLHHVEGFVDGDLRAALDHRASLRQLRGLVQRRRLDDAVARGPLADRSLRDRAIGFQLVHRSGERIAWVDDRRAQLREPAGPLLHDARLLRRRLGHAAAVIDKEVSHGAKFARSSPRSASAEA